MVWISYHPFPARYSKLFEFQCSSSTYHYKFLELYKEFEVQRAQEETPKYIRDPLERLLGDDENKKFLLEGGGKPKNDTVDGNTPAPHHTQLRHSRRRRAMHDTLGTGKTSCDIVRSKVTRQITLTLDLSLKALIQCDGLRNRISHTEVWTCKNLAV